MSIYIVIWLYSIVISYAFISKNTGDRVVKKIPSRMDHTINRTSRSTKAFIGTIAISIPIIAVSGFRFGIGTDYYYTYLPTFKRAMAGIRSSSNDVGFYYLTVALSKLSSSFYLYIFLLSTVTCILIIVRLYRSSTSFIESIFLFFATEFYFVSFNNVRQCLAFSLCFFAVHWLTEKQYAKYLALVLIATSLHASSIAYALLLPLCLAQKINWEKVIRILAIIAVLLVTASGRIGQFLVERTRLSNYIVYSIYTGRTIIWPTILYNMLVLAIFIYAVRKEKILEEEAKIYIFIQICAVIICLLDGTIPGAYRFLRVFSFFHMLSIPFFCGKIKPLQKRIVAKALLYLFVLMICIVEIFMWHNEAIIPYTSIFNH